jgi:hypothetical protein
MENSTYQGWTNYATWRINLEIFDGFDLEGYSTSTAKLSIQLKDYLEDCIFDCYDEGLVKDYARAFASDVNWYEIASHLLADKEEAA